MSGKPALALHAPSDEDMEFLNAILFGVGLLGRAAKKHHRPRLGRPKNAWRQIGVKDLARIFHEMTGNRPTLARDAYNDRGGHHSTFRDFCIAALTPIDGKQSAMLGIDPLITRVLYVQK
jgi:hypothetical protein